MRAIVDSGSTTSKWAICDESLEMIDEFQLKGINPTSNPDSLLEFSKIPIDYKQNINEVFYYGSGVNTPESKARIIDALKNEIPLDYAEIENDLLGACRAVSPDEESIVVILGTGTNACYFDGKEIGEKLPSLGYLFDDYGSGYHIGREVIIRYFYKKMPAEDLELFESEYGGSRDEIITPIYNTLTPNSKIASYSAFLSRCSDELRHSICNYIFTRFLDKKIAPISNSKNLKLNFIGSIAFYFREELEATCREKGFECGKFVRNPLKLIVKYHQHR